ncbi:MAG: glycosyltransferase [Prevotellaceae bacterium]|jgi:glycosyltransferase involved in cell wall biosynthesis|nr:glycosyltransferase [Prevotellaceae bacterium]
MSGFSIIIPVYNTLEKLLRQCLDSVVNQDYTNFEVICIKHQI